MFKKTKMGITKMLDELEGCPDTSFEREVICDGDDTFLLSTDNMKALKKFHESVIRKFLKYFTSNFIWLKLAWKKYMFQTYYN